MKYNLRRLFMKFKTIKSIISLALCVMILSCGGIAHADEAGILAAGGGVSTPMYTTITLVLADLEINAFGKATCDGRTNTQPNYTAGVVVELQKYDGEWTTIMEWSDYDVKNAMVSAEWFVLKGYDYRVKTSHYAYKLTGKLVESDTLYSTVVSF